MDLMEKDLQCPVCLELFTSPIVLPCSHTLCRQPCAEMLFRNNFIRCPVCRDSSYVSGGISSLPRVIALENIVNIKRAKDVKEEESERQNAASDLAANGEVVQCQLCESVSRRAKRTCLDCNASYCGPCLQVSHPNREPFSGHELVEPRKDMQPKELLCMQHREKLNSYCQDCRKLGCLVCEELRLHVGHSVVSSEKAYRELKDWVEENAAYLERSQSVVISAVKSLKQELTELQILSERKGNEINSQCDLLVAKIEEKRSFFNADLDYEKRANTVKIDDQICALEKLLQTSQNLCHYAKSICKKREPTSFLQLAGTLNEHLLKLALECSECVMVPCNLSALLNKMVDFRRERNILRNLHYLSVPTIPAFANTCCFCSENAAVLVIQPSVSDVVDSLEVYYYEEEEGSAASNGQTVICNYPQGNRQKEMSSSISSFVVVISQLAPATKYVFSVSASNTMGKSPSSEEIHCMTLAQNPSFIPVPIILESLCRWNSSAVQIFSTSPLDILDDDCINHYLIYRSVLRNEVWHSMLLFGRQEHRVFGLEPNTEYEFMILAVDSSGHYQTSNLVVLQTEQTLNSQFSLS